MKKDKFSKEKKIFRSNGGVLKTSKAIELGIHPSKLYEMADKGIIDALSRGLFHLKEMPLSNPDFVIITQKIPKGIICLISALAIHNLTTQIPQEIMIALPQNSWIPQLKHPPIKIFWFDKKNYSSGVEKHQALKSDTGTSIHL